MKVTLTFFSCLIVIGCKFRNCSHSLNLGAMVTLSDDDEVDAMTQALGECSIQSVLLITSSEMAYWPVDWILRQDFLTSVRMSHYDIVINKTDSLAELIWDFYHRIQIRHYIIVTSHYRVVIDMTSRLFYDKQRGEGAVLPHKATFTLVVPYDYVDESLPDMTGIPLDNIALVAINEESRKVQRVFTLMFRESRRRGWESVDLFGDFPNPSQSCRIFPNTRFGLNGRTLTILAKEWLSHLYKKTNKITGRLEYVGFYVNIINILSNSLNFTINFTPQPAENDTTTWSEFSNKVGFGEVDFGATTYITSSALYFNHSVSFPILWSNVSGVYLNSERAPVTSPLKLFRLEVYGCLLASLLFTMTFHWILANISLDSKEHSKEHSKKFDLDAQHYICNETKHSLECTNSKRRNSGISLNQRHPNSDIMHSGDRNNDSIVVFDCTHKLNAGSDHKAQHSDVGLYDHIHYSDDETHNTFQKNNGTYKRYTSIGTQTDSREIDPVSGICIRTHSPLKRELTPCDCKIHYIKTSKLQCNRHNKTNLIIAHSDDNSTRTFHEVHHQMRNFPGKSERKGRCIEQIIELFFKFVGSIFSQDSLPEPKKCSARILLWSWCLMLLVLTAVFTGNITANLVDQGNSIPFSTFEELLQRKDYKWGIFRDSSFYTTMKNAKNNTTLRKLYEKIEEFALTDPKVRGSFEDQVVKLRTEKYVTFFFTDDLEYLRGQMNLNDLVIMKDNVMMSNMGFIFPNNSTLNELISESLQLMVDTGVLDYLHRTKTNGSSGARPSRDTSETALDLFYMEGLFFCCGCGLAMAGFFLILECVYGKLVTFC